MRSVYEAVLGWRWRRLVWWVTRTPLVRRGRCWVHGHSATLHLDAGVLQIRCSACGYCSPGWDCGSQVLRFEPPSHRARAKRVVTTRYRDPRVDAWLAHSDRWH